MAEQQQVQIEIDDLIAAFTSQRDEALNAAATWMARARKAEREVAQLREALEDTPDENG